MSKWPRVTSILLLGLLAGAVHAQSSILVDTTADGVMRDGSCSFREALIASNLDRNADTLSTQCAGSGVNDDIRFRAGSNPLITVATALPVITDTVTITGSTGRVTINGPGSLNGIEIAASAPGTVVSRLVIQDFSLGILVFGANSVLTGNFIGTNSAGTAAVPNAIGVDVEVSGVRIGGTSGNTPGGACSGDCNLISGNTQFGMFVVGTGTNILGNYIGTNAAGTAAINTANPGTGMRIAATGTTTIGGTTPAAANLISGNYIGVEFIITQNGAGSSVVGNLVGTDAVGTSALGNVYGISLDLTGHNYPVAIGGSVAGAGNVISGNIVHGIRLAETGNTVIKGNRIGTQANGTSPLGNVGAGIAFNTVGANLPANNNVIGGAVAGDGNVIAWNFIGVLVGGGNQNNTIIGNSIHDHPGLGIQLDDMQNGTAPAVSISGLNPTTGNACAGCRVDVYSDAADEGRTYQGSVLANGSGFWSFPGAVDGPYVTATATSLGGSTSQFSFQRFEDSDGDALADIYDNCIAVANANQLDADRDGYGNLCDADLDNSALVTVQDFNLFRTVLNRQAGSGALAAAADFDGSGMVTVQDYNRMRLRLNQAPGPSGLACAGTVPCGTT